MRLITCRGIGESLNSDINMLAPVRKFFSSQFEVVDLPWKAVYGPVGGSNGDITGDSFKHNMLAGQTLLRAELDKGPAIVAGYSGGAAVAGNVAASGHENLVAVGLVADPYMPDLGSGKYGVAGARPIPPGKVFWEADPADIICQCPSYSPVREFADLTTAMAFSDPIYYGQDLLDKLINNKWQRWWDIQSVLRIGEAIRGVQGYLPPGTDHVGYAMRIKPGTKVTYIQDLINTFGKYL